MRILHLSDLHYGQKYKAKIERMFPYFLKKIKVINNEKEIDLIVFTGDLVWSGNKIDNFKEVNKKFIKPILDEISIEKDNFIICSGNHDMSDQKELPAITDYINKFSSNDDLDKFIEDKDKQFDLSYEKSIYYYNFVKDYYPEDNIDKLYHTFQRKIKDKEIGIISFHTPWRSFVGEYSGHLLLPKKVIYDALSSIPGNNLYISLMHHPINDLKSFNSYVVEDIIYEKFHINFSGHYHKKKQGVVFTYDIGMLSVSSMASMSGNEGSSIGFSIVDIDIDTFEITITNYSYIKADNIFVLSSKIEHKLPMNEEKAEQVKLLKRLKELYDNVLQEANSLLINYEDVGDKTFLNYFNDPVLKEKSYYESIKTQNNLNTININQLINANFIIYGKDKFGKTSLLRKIQLDIIDSFIIKKTIPIYIDLKYIKSIDNFDLKHEIKKTFHLTEKKSLMLISKNKFQFLIDNFNQDNRLHTELINKLVNEATDFSITLTSEETQESFISNLNFNNVNIDKLFIHPITRKNIRTQVSKMLINYDSEKKQEIIQKISLIFSQMSIPFNYWHLSLFLWIYKKEKNISINDNIEMLTLYVDKLLEREQITRYNKNIDYELFKKLLGELSYNLLTKHYDNNYAMSYRELVSFIDNFQDKNIRFVTDVKEIIDYLLDKGVIKLIKPVDRYTYRLNGIMEYFTAVYMVEDNNFLEEVLNDDKYFLEFANEIEVFAGLNRKNINLLKKLHDKTNSALRAINDKYGNNPDETLNDKIQHSKDLAKSIVGINISDQLPIAIEKQDEMLDDVNPVQEFNEDVKIKEPVSFRDEYTPVQLEKHIFILARAFRSLSLIDDLNQMNDTFELILISYINMGFEFLNEIDFVKEKFEKDIEKKIIDALTCFIPLVTQLTISDAVLHKNLTRFLEKRIEVLEKNKEDNQYKLTILYFMLLDADLKANQTIIEKIDSNINLLSLKNISVVKLLYYLLFKSQGNKQIEKFLKNKIVEIQLKLNPRADKSRLINNISKKLLTERQ